VIAAAAAAADKRVAVSSGGQTTRELAWSLGSAASPPPTSVGDPESLYRQRRYDSIVKRLTLL